MKHTAIWALSLVLSAGCSSGSTDDQPPAPTAPALAGFALGFQPGGDGADQVIERAQRRVQAAPDEAGEYVRLAEAFLIRRRETGEPSYLAYAKDALSAAATLAPNDPDVTNATIMMLFDDHRFAQAADMARKVIAAEPSDPTAYLLLSDAMLELGKYDDAIDALQQAQDLLPDLRSYSRIAYIRWLHNDIDGAYESMDAAIRVAGRNPEPAAWCYVDLGTMLWHSGRYDAAARAAERALALVPEYVPALSLQARVLASRGQRDQAIALLDTVNRRLPTAEALLQLSELLASQGRARDAAARLAQAEKLAAHDPAPVSLYYARHQIKPERAVELAEKAVAERATIYNHDVLAMALLRQGRYDEAKQAITRALALGTPDARLLLHRGLIELATGDVQAARASLDEARKLNPNADPVVLAELAGKLGTTI